MEKLNIGAGNDKRIGWINTDIEEDWHLMKREENSVDAILFSHTIMYVRPEDKLLEKFYSWLRKGGSLHIETQDLTKIQTPEELFGMGIYAGHRWAWTPKTLGLYMESVGFKDIVSMRGILHGKPERDFLISGIK